LKALRKQSKELQDKVKTKGLVLTTAEQLVIQNVRALILHRQRSIVLKIAFENYFILAAKNFQDSFGFQQQQLHNKIAIESHLYHSFK